jgi:hypothetical protein
LFPGLRDPDPVLVRVVVEDVVLVVEEVTSSTIVDRLFVAEYV